MTDFDQAFAKLNKVGGKITWLRGDIPNKLVLKELRPAYSALCSAYEHTTLDQRIDTYLFFETRDNLLEELVKFAGDSAQQAVRLLAAQKQPMARSMLKQAVAADLIVNGRCEPKLLDATQDSLLKAVDALSFDLDAYAGKLDLSASAFSKRAVQLQKAGSRFEAIKALGIALQMNPELASHPKALEMAGSLTGKPGHAAIALLSNPFERTVFIAEQIREQNKKTRSRGPKQAESPLKFWLTTLAGVVILAALPPIVFPLIFGPNPNPAGAPPGLIVGVVTSVMYFISQLKRRP